MIEEGFDVIRRTGNDYKDDSSDMHIIVESMASDTDEHSRVSIRTGDMHKIPNFDRIHDALIQLLKDSSGFNIYPNSQALMIRLN